MFQMVSFPHVVPQNHIFTSANKYINDYYYNNNNNTVPANTGSFLHGFNTFGVRCMIRTIYEV